MGDQKQATRKPLDSDEDETRLDLKYLIDGLNQLSIQLQDGGTLESLLSRLDDHRTRGRSTTVEDLACLLLAIRQNTSSSAESLTDSELLQLAVHVLSQIGPSATIGLFQVMINDAFRISPTGVCAAPLGEDSDDDHHTLQTFDCEADLDSLDMEDRDGPDLVPIQRRPPDIPHQQPVARPEGQPKKQKGSAKTGQKQKCRFCTNPRKDSCKCVDNFPKRLARDIWDSLPEGDAREKLEEYLKELAKKEEESKARHKKDKHSDAVYECKKCETNVLKGHICEVDKIPRSLLERIRREIPESFLGIGVIDTYLASQHTPVNLVDYYRRLRRGEREIADLFQREIEDSARRSTLEVPPPNASNQDDIGDRASSVTANVCSSCCVSYSSTQILVK